MANNEASSAVGQVIPEPCIVAQPGSNRPRLSIRSFIHHTYPQCLPLSIKSRYYFYIYSISCPMWVIQTMCNHSHHQKKATPSSSSVTNSFYRNLHWLTHHISLHLRKYLPTTRGSRGPENTRETLSKRERTRPVSRHGCCVLHPVTTA